MPDTLNVRPLTLRLDRLATPIGELLLLADEEDRLRSLDWSDYEHRMALLLRRHYGAGGWKTVRDRDPGGLSGRMAAYFEGDLGSIDGLPSATGGTAFQRAVWQALRAIPCGTTISYRRLAERIGRPAAVRAVGLANGANPVAIVVPCHRVIGSDGSLTGYGGGLERKRWLLAHEGAAHSQG
ncbi:methylated-DNA-[protein]-cysteine S-methyltransferase [Tistlia consotensis]|uniref:Methylated-DNA--protein-cysteine methyltransferase n=1 Tax=Tistlia consotensis USBA 355 TaxID=560819 RepID=A0A1Y6BKF0_9PROT|nr:methylated-DNA--[protein]-cysteine S-methyltransferase [Tistlia consotensis]SMF07927.1 methylated-DNA-[protein]-cysteine S-methyltransferase [Tistlia consotensis USBA 355]SNR35636.1 methylated-DNA-[protein]-cysteine S-methyltransferase [Tistlia consotensis]